MKYIMNNDRNMYKLVLLFLFVISAYFVKAQNPFAEYGYTPKIATLSQGQFNEFFDNDTIVQIGSVLYNTKSMQIVAFVETDTLHSEATLEPDIVSRWISPDPLSEERNWISPYNYCQNNPILRIDPDGALDDEWDLLIKQDGTNNLTKVSDKGGDKTQYVNVKWETKSGDKWNLGTKTYNNWPNSSLAMADIKSNGQSALGPWNQKWHDKASGRIDLSPVDPIDFLTGAIATKWAVGGARAAIAAEGVELASETSTQGFKSFSAFKRVNGSAGEGQAWHHIVEQTPGNISEFGAQSVHNTGNLVKLPNGAGTIHAKVSGYYSSIQPFSHPQTVRQWLSPQSFQQQYEFGIQTLQKYGW